MAKGFDTLRNAKGLVNDYTTELSFRARKIFDRHAELSMFIAGLALLYSGSSELAHAGSGDYGAACNGILLLVEGTFGALITAAAGIGAIVASAVGGFKMAWSLIVVSVGAFILRSYITLFNGDCGGAGA